MPGVVIPLTIRDLTRDDLPSCAWTGSSKSNFAEALDRANRSEVDYLVVCPPVGVAALACAAALVPVWAVTLSGRPFGSPNIGGTIRPTTVTLADGATATATLQITDPANFGTACFLPGQTPAPGRPGKLPTAAGLRVGPPNPRSFTYKVIPFPFSACYSTSSGPVYLNTTPVRRLLPGVSAGGGESGF